MGEQASLSGQARSAEATTCTRVVCCAKAAPAACDVLTGVVVFAKVGFLST